MQRAKVLRAIAGPGYGGDYQIPPDDLVSVVAIVIVAIAVMTYVALL